MWNQRPCFRFEIDNFSEKEATIASHEFVSGGCEWYLYVNPKGDSLCDDQLPLFLSVANPKSLGRGWERRADYYCLLLNQSEKELYKTPIARSIGFCAETTDYAFRKTLPLSKFQEKGFLENDRLIIEVYIKVIEAFHGEGGEFASQVNSVRNILAEHPEIAEDFKPKNQVVKTDYMKILSNACSKLSELAEVGFKHNWLKSKLGEVSSEWKKVDDSDESRVQELEERINNLGLMESSFKMDCLKSKLEEVSLEKKKPDDSDESRVQQLEERVNNLEQMELGFKLDCFKSKLEEVSFERKTSSDTDGSRVQQLEERLKNLELMNRAASEIAEESKTSDQAVGSLPQQHEEWFPELMDLDLNLNRAAFEILSGTASKIASEIAEGLCKTKFEAP